MKRLAILCCLTLLCAGCGYPTPAQRRQKVIESFKTTEVQSIPDAFGFLARLPDGSIWYAECRDNEDPHVTGRTLLFGPLKQ